MPRKRPWLPLALLLVVVFASGLGRPDGAGAARPAQVTRALDYLHAHQSADGRFQDAAYTPWAILAIAAAGEDPDGSAWTASKGSPVDYLQGIDLAANASSSTVGNAPCYYAKMILAYVAAGRSSSISSAGSKKIDLVSKLLAYQRSDGRFCPTSSSDYIGAVNTTTWAILALEAAGSAASAQADAVSWLKDEQLSDGGFASMAKDGPGTPSSDVDDTAAAIQALIAGGVSRSNGVITDARSYLQSAQRSDGGFSSTKSGTYTYAESTAWAVQAILALGESPTASAWTSSGGNARDALRRLQASSGALCHRTGIIATPMLSTTQSLIALAGKTFSTFPSGSASWVSAFKCSPAVTKLEPANASQQASSTVLVTATYRDGGGGTGIAASGVTLSVDGKDLTEQAQVSSSNLRVRLTGAAAGTHTIKLTIRDRAGNARSVTHSVTVGAVASTEGTGSTSTGSVASGDGSASLGDESDATADDASGASGTDGVPFPSASSSTAAASASPGATGTTDGSPDGTGTSGDSDSSRKGALLAVCFGAPIATGLWLASRARWRHWGAISRVIEQTPKDRRDYYYGSAR